MFAWPMRPNWESPVRVTYRFDTEVIVSRDGAEQRIAKRYEPRLSIEFETLESASRFGSATAHLHLRQNEEAICPLWHLASRIGMSVSSGASAIAFASAPNWAQAGAVLVLQEGDAAEAVQVSSVAGDTVNLASPLAGSWGPAAFVTEGVPGYLTEKVKQELVLDRTGGVEMEFDATPGGYPARGEGTSGDTLAGLEILPLEINWGDRRENQNLVIRETVDFGFGRIKHHAPVAFPTVTREASVLGETEKLEALEQFFLRHRGRQREFYCRSYQRDFEPVSGVTALGSSLRVKGTWAYDLLNGNTVHRAVCLSTRAGKLYRQIDSVSLDGENTLIVVGEPWGDSHNLNQILGASMLNVSRFASDALTVDWRTGKVGSAKLSIQTLEDLTVPA